MLRFSCMFFLCLIIQSAGARECERGPLNGLFFQPLYVDLSLSSNEWDNIFQKLHSIGITRIYLQWTVFEEADFRALETSDQEPFLHTVLEAANDHEVDVYIGLVADQQWFSLSRQLENSLANYLNTLRIQTRLQADTLLENFSDILFAGWYLPYEINDEDWLDTTSRKLLTDFIEKVARDLQQRRPDSKIAISGYSGGNLSPDQYAQFWQEILENPNILFLYQDGAGTGTLNANDRNLYIQKLYDSMTAGRWEIISELFRQTSESGQEFAAVPVEIEALSSQLSRRLMMAPNTGIAGFSLRYLLENNSLLLGEYSRYYCAGQIDRQ